MATHLPWDLPCVFIMLLCYCTESTKNATIHKNETTTLGETVTLKCNRSEYVAVVEWRREKLLFFYSYFRNKTNVNNLTSERRTVDPVDPVELKIHRVQLTDMGNYICTTTSRRGVHTTVWSLTIIDADDESKGRYSLQDHLFYIIRWSIGVVLCISIFYMVCLCRKNKQDQSP
ncbi:hypothetical protein UPYG_G00306230 [Umbra pygmaea]|uniref:Ig-like domain-containing protein n=1 Tax=Umbra pygmaea TaxID=75934 RepID=A0ABD0VYU6_UMBPY